VTDPIPYVPLDGKPWRLAMGLRPLAPGGWLEVDDHRGEELAEKYRLLAADPSTVTVWLPGSEAAGAELLEALVADLGEHHPGLISPNADGTITERTTGAVVEPARLHPVDAAARLVQEDLCLLDRGRLVAASVCFPSRWRLADKLGADLSGIHGPVPGYEDTLARPTAAFFDRLRPERPVWRLNWTLIDRPDLHQPDPAGRRAGGGDGLWFRVERQTLRRLPESGAVVFTIRTYVTPLDELLVARPQVAEALRATLPTVPADTLAYKGWAELAAVLLTRLEANGATGGD